MENNELSKNAMGGTELMLKKLHDSLEPELINECQIIPSRVRELHNDKIRIYWVHDLALDPEVQHLANKGWEKFHKIVFVSHYQMKDYITRFNIPWSKCIVMPNAINPIEDHQKPDDVIRLVYTSTPHRGLNILYHVFDKLSQNHEDVELDVYSSFKLYGWPERDEQFKELFDLLEQHPKINYYGTKSNEEVREGLKNCHIFAYPSTWEETSCLCLMEAMSAGLVCVHPNYGALYETAANWTMMYHYHEDLNKHASMFYSILNSTIADLKQNKLSDTLRSQKEYANVFYNWEARKQQWASLVRSLLNEPREIPSAKFVYNY